MRKLIKKTSAMTTKAPSEELRKGRASPKLPTKLGMRDHPLSDVHHAPGTQKVGDIGTGERHPYGDSQILVALADLIDEIVEQWRRRQMWHRAEKSLTLQAKSMCRRLLAGDKDEAEALYKSAMNGGDHALALVAIAAMAPLLLARDTIEQHRILVEKRLTALAKDTPVAQWVEDTRGFGLLSCAGIVGEAGDLSKYANPAKLWKRMGLAVMPDGDRQRIVSGDAAIDHGYNPARRSLMWTIGDCIVKVGGPYREIYDQRKAYETAKNEAGEYADRAARMLKQKSFAKTTAAFKCYSAGKLPPLHLHMSAKRYMEKRLLRDLWRAWRLAILIVTPTGRLPASDVLSGSDHSTQDVHQPVVASAPL